MVQTSVITILSWIANVPAQEISPATYLREDLEMDSLDLTLCIARLERFFNVVFSNEQIEAIETVADVSDCIELQLV